MNHAMVLPGPGAGPALPSPASRLLAHARAADRILLGFAIALLGLAALFALGWALDERTLRGASVWIKPFKFAVSIALLAVTTALCASVVDPARRQTRSMRLLRATLLATGSFELAYIALQAGLGEGSHFNVGDPLHAAMYSAMGVAAIALTATQPWLAWHVARGAAPGTPAALRLAVVLGLVLTFVLGAGSGLALGGGAAPTNAGGLPLLGWTFGAGDLRPAHFVGMHAGQAIPLVGAWLAWRHPRSTGGGRAVATVIAFALLWTTLFAVALAAAFLPLPTLLA